MQKLNERLDRRRIRRAMSPDEAGRLIDAARRRPLAERQTNRGSAANLSAKTVDNLRWLGTVRATAYATMLQTGLRYGECRSIRIGDVHLDAATPYLELRATHEKNRQGSKIAVNVELASCLTEYLRERVELLTSHSNLVPFAGVADMPVFELPVQMTKVFDADLKFAGIAKTDEAGRTLDVHAMRHSFITNLAKAGVPLVVAQKAARHSTPTLTSNVYTHIGLADIGDAVNNLPSLNVPDAAVETVNSDEKSLTQILTHVVHNSMLFSASNCNSGDKDGAVEKSQNTPETGGFTGEKDGGRYWTRTSDFLRVRQAL